MRHAFELALTTFFEESGLNDGDDALFDAWDVLHPDGQDEASHESGAGHNSMSAADAVGKMPYDWSPARVRCVELAQELAARDFAASQL